VQVTNFIRWCGLCLLLGTQIASTQPRYTGVAVSESLEVAQAQALQDLAKNIHSSVIYAYRSTIIEQDDEIEEQSSLLEAVISAVEIEGIQQNVEDVTNGYQVTKWVTHDRVQTYFQRLKKKILHYCLEADKAVANLNIGLCLHDYYCALLLSRVYPDSLCFPQNHTRQGDKLNPYVLHILIENLLQRINLKAGVVYPYDSETIVIELSATLDRKPIHRLGIRYNSGPGKEKAIFNEGITRLSYYYKPTGATISLTIEIIFPNSSLIEEDAMANTLHKTMQALPFDPHKQVKANVRSLIKIDFEARIKGHLVEFTPLLKWIQPASFYWDFGDGHNSNKQIASHTYEKADDYSVTLKLNNDDALQCIKRIDLANSNRHRNPSQVIPQPPSSVAMPERHPPSIIELANTQNLTRAQKKLSDWHQMDLCRFGTRRFFVNPAGKYLLICSAQKVIRVLWFNGRSYFDVINDRQYNSLDDFAGYSQLWIHWY
jgi:hypothetical protein